MSFRARRKPSRRAVTAASAAAAATLDALEPRRLLAFPATVTFAPGEWQTSFDVTAVDDLLPEPDEPYEMYVLPGSGYTTDPSWSRQSAVIESDVPTVWATVADDAPAATEGGQAAQVTFRRDNTSGPLAARYRLINPWDDDDVIVPGTPDAEGFYPVAFADGQDAVTVTVTAVDDPDVEPAELATLALIDNTGPNAIAGQGKYRAGDGARPSQVDVQIKDDDVYVSVAAEGHAAEDGCLIAGFRVTRDAGDVTRPLDVYFDLSGTAAAGTDYTTDAGGVDYVTIPANAYEAYVNVFATDDEEAEWTEEIEFRVAENDAYTCPPHPADPADADALVLLKDDDVSFDLEKGTLVANYDDDDGDGVTDYAEGPMDGGPDDDLYEIKLRVPRTSKAGTTVTLSAPSAYFNVWESEFKFEQLTPTTPNGNEYMWTDPTGVPQSVWLEVKRGSSAVNDITTSLLVNDNGDVRTQTQDNTAVNFEVIALSDPNGDGGGDVKNKPRKWLVGQTVHQMVTIQAPPDWKADATFQWSVPGHVLRDYVVDASAATTRPLTDDDGGVEGQSHQETRTGLKLSEVKFFWVSNGTAGSGPDVKSPSVTVGNVNGRSYSVSTKYDLYRPQVVAESVAISAPEVTHPPFFWGLYLSSQNYAKDGFRWNAKLSVPGGFASKGHWNFVQLVSPFRTYTDATRIWHAGGSGLWGLDTKFPYADPMLTPYNATVDGRLAFTIPEPAGSSMGDKPGHILAGIQANGGTTSSIADQFDSYIMYLPPGGGSRWVPLRLVQWSWSATAVWSAARSAWILQLGGRPDPAIDPPPVSVDSVTHPTWNMVHTSATLGVWK